MKEKLSKVGLLLFPLILPLPVNLIFSSIALVVFMLVCVLNYNKTFKFKYINKHTKLILISFIALFMIDAITSLFLGLKLKLYDVKLPFLLLPIMFIISSDFINKNKKFIIKAFIVGQVLYFSYAILYIIYFYFFLTNESFAFNSYLRYALYNHLPGAIHHTYLGLNILLSIIFIEEYKIIANKYAKISILFVFIIFSVILSAKIINVALIGYIIFRFLKNKHKIIYFLLTVVLFLLFFLNYKSLFNKLESSYSSRIDIWECAFKIINDNWLFGVGRGHIKTMIYDCNRFLGYNDAHNMWVQEWLSNGLLGIGLLAVIFILLIKAGMINKRLLFLVIILFFAGLTEHILHLQRGVMFFSFFTLLFLVGDFWKPKQDNYKLK